jgi:hypothetical protein
VWQVDRSVTRLGRAADCDITLDDSLASRYHAEIQVTGQGLRVKDLGSTNKTLVNGSPISEVPLNDGDQIQIGNTRLQVVTGGATRPTAPQPQAPASPAPAAPKTPRPAPQPPPARSAKPTPAGAEAAAPAAKEAEAAAPPAATTSRSSRIRLLAVLLVVAILGFAAVILLTSGQDPTTGPGGAPADSSEAGSGTATEPDAGPGPSFPSPSAESRGADPGVVYPEEAVALYEEGLSLFQYGRLVRARETLEAALEVAPDYRDAQDVLRRTLSAIDTRVEASMQRARSAMEALRYEEARRALEEVFFLLEEDDDRLVEAQRIRDRIGQ